MPEINPGPGNARKWAGLISRRLRGERLVEVRRDLVGPELAVGRQALGADVDAASLVLAVVAGNGVGVGALERDAAVPERLLRGPDLGHRGVGRRVVAHLGDEPGELPTGLLGRGADDGGEAVAVLVAGRVLPRRGLVAVGLALVPEHRAETAGPEAEDAGHHLG